MLFFSSAFEGDDEESDDVFDPKHDGNAEERQMRKAIAESLREQADLKKKEADAKKKNDNKNGKKKNNNNDDDDDEEEVNVDEDDDEQAPRRSKRRQAIAQNRMMARLEESRMTGESTVSIAIRAAYLFWKSHMKKQLKRGNNNDDDDDDNDDDDNKNDKNNNKKDDDDDDDATEEVDADEDVDDKKSAKRTRRNSAVADNSGKRPRRAAAIASNNRKSPSRKNNDDDEEALLASRLDINKRAFDRYTQQLDQLRQACKAAHAAVVGRSSLAHTKQEIEQSKTMMRLATSHELEIQHAHQQAVAASKLLPRAARVAVEDIDPLPSNVIVPGAVSMQVEHARLDRAAAVGDLNDALARLRFLDDKRKEEHQNTPCPVCWEPFNGIVATFVCGHAVCSDCFDKMLGGGVIRCPNCRRLNDRDKVIKVVAKQSQKANSNANNNNNNIDDDNDINIDLDIDDEKKKKNNNNDDDDNDKDDKKEKGEGDDVAVTNGRTTMAWLTRTPLAVAAEKKSDYGTKVLFGVSVLQNIAARDPTAKTIVFSQWANLLKVVGCALKEAGLAFVFPSNVREFSKYLDEFKSAKGPNILLLELRRGNKGLNITEANYVVFMEPVYNIALEKQAIGRIHRMGQKKEAYVIRLVAKETIEEAMYAQRASAVGLSMRADSDSISSRDFRKLLSIK